MPYHNPNSRSRRNVLRIVGVLVVLAVIAGVANFLHATTSEAAGNVKPQIETMQGIRQTAQDSITALSSSLVCPSRLCAATRMLSMMVRCWLRYNSPMMRSCRLSDSRYLICLASASRS